MMIGQTVDGHSLHLNLGVLPGQEALLKAAVHGERNQRQHPPVPQECKRGQEGLTERFPVLTELTGLLSIDVVQERGDDNSGQNADA